MSPDDPRHGSLRGYSAHRRDTEKPCADCRKAASDYERERYNDAYLKRTRKVANFRIERRIRALQAIGWTSDHLAKELGYEYGDAYRSMLRGEWCTRKTARRVFAVYEKLAMTPGPSRITSLRAARAGWPPPLAWDNIDDPDEQPTDWAYRAPTRAEIVADLDEKGAGISEVCKALDITRKSLERWCVRNGQWELFKRIRGREYVAQEYRNQWTKEAG